MTIKNNTAEFSEVHREVHHMLGQGGAVGVAVAGNRNDYFRSCP